ncbi:metal ABC transporter ATP-binding protein [Dermacoccaceae bacterium W4C1]
MNPPAPTDQDIVLSLRSAAFGYGDRTVVTVDLDVARGEVLALLGPNGSGKSTLVRGLLGLTEHRSGTARLLGEDLSKLHDRHRIGYVPQRHTLSNSVRATVGEVVAVGRLPRMNWWGRPRAADRAAIAHCLDLVGLADRINDDVSTLSGGQQRRVLIARALAAQPEMLVMDEPTAGVDESSQHVLAQVLQRLTELDTTMLIVTHELTALAGVVNRVVELSGGGVHFDGSLSAYAAHRHDELDQGCHPDEPTGPQLHLPSAGPMSSQEHHA